MEVTRKTIDALQEILSLSLNIGTKQVRAVAMNRQEYNDLRGWKLPADENGQDDGYLIEDMDSGKANTAYFDGYISWSPREVFVNSYRSAEEMSFGHALEQLKAGAHVSRYGWNGIGIFIALQQQDDEPLSIY